jgi:hypothetical protein
MREECLREFGFSDVYRLDKQNENNLALQVCCRQVAAKMSRNPLDLARAAGHLCQGFGVAICACAGCIAGPPVWLL